MGKPIRIIPITIAGFFLSCTVALNAQNILTEIDHDAHRQYDRLFVLSGGGDSSLHSAIKPYWRYDLVLLADSAVQYLADSRSRHDIQSIWDQNNEFVFSTSPDSVMAGLERYRTSRHPLWKTFYRTPAHFYQVDVKDFYLRVNPILRLSAGYDSGESYTLFYNQRGLSIR